jgi:uncharacterized membrane protein
MLKPKKTGISPQYSLMIIIAAIVLFISLLAPSFAATLNFTRFYSITLLFLSPCFALGGQAFLATIGKAWIKLAHSLRHQITPRSENMERMLSLIAIILCGYFLSQVGFVNYVTNGPVHSYSTDFQRMLTSNESWVEISLYGAYIPEQDVFSASWLSNHKAETAEVFHDSGSTGRVLVSYGLVPVNLLFAITNATILVQDSFVYLGTLNTVDDLVTTGAVEPSRTSEISFFRSQNDLVYSNGNSDIWYVTSTH